MLMPRLWNDSFFDNWMNDFPSSRYLVERYQGNCSRSFYVGDSLTEEDIKAKFDNGTLTMEIPKVSAQKVENKKTIAIEG